MINLKTKEDIEILRAGGQRLAQIVDTIAKAVQPGVHTADLSRLADELIAKYDGQSSFKNYQPDWAPTPFPSAVCLSVNTEVVHGLPFPDRELKAGDIVGVDCGLVYQGRYTDMAVTVPVGNITKSTQKLLHTTQEALAAGIAQVKPGNKVSDIAKAVEKVINKGGCSAVRQLVGHGVGFSIHEDPAVPNFYDKSFPDVELVPGLVIAIEPMVNAGDWEVDTLEDGWTIVTADNSLSAHFEHTVAVTDTGHIIITAL